MSRPSTAEVDAALGGYAEDPDEWVWSRDPGSMLAAEVRALREELANYHDRLVGAEAELREVREARLDRS